MATEIPADCRYNASHEWAKENDGAVVVGITDHAQSQLGDVVFVDLPEAGTDVTAGESFGEIESTKSVSELISPVSGTISEVNATLEQGPEAVNSDPYGDGWMLKVTPSAPLEDLLDADGYQASIEG